MVNRLAEETRHPGRPAPLFVFGWISAGGDNDRDPFRFIHSPQPIHNSEAIPVDGATVGHIGREVDVEKDEIGLLPSDGAKRGRAVLRGEHLITFRLQQFGHRLQEHKVVIND